MPGSKVTYIKSREASSELQQGSATPYGPGSLLLLSGVHPEIDMLWEKEAGEGQEAGARALQMSLSSSPWG